MRSFIYSLLLLSFLIIFPSPIFAAYRVGVNYHQTGSDIDTTTFIRQYHLPGVRDQVKTQLEDMANVGTKVINTRLWLTDPDPNSFPNVSQRLEFPLTTQSLANIRQYVQDVAAINTPNGKPMDLYLTLLWQGCAAYNGGYAQWCNYTWDQFVYYAKYTIDQFFASIGDLTRPDGSKAVQLAFFDGEVIIEKVNTDKMLTQVYPYFVEKAKSVGINPTIYFMLIPDGSLERFFAPTVDFMIQNNLYLPHRLDISFYPVPGYPQANYTTGYGPVVDNTITKLQSAYPGHTFAIAETYYPSSPTVRRELGLAFASAAKKYGTLEEVLLWPDFDVNGTDWEAPQPYDVLSYSSIGPIGTISTSPNPCLAPTDVKTCITTVSWTSTGATNPSVYVSGSLFAQSPSGSQKTWGMPSGQSATFALYDEPNDIVLSSVTVDTISSTSLPGDFNSDGHVNAADYTIFIAGFGTKYTILDYATLVANWGK